MKPSSSATSSACVKLELSCGFLTGGKLARSATEVIGSGTSVVVATVSFVTRVVVGGVLVGGRLVLCSGRKGLNTMTVGAGTGLVVRGTSW